MFICAQKGQWMRRRSAVHVRELRYKGIDPQSARLLPPNSLLTFLPHASQPKRFQDGLSVICCTKISSQMTRQAYENYEVEEYTKVS